MKSRATAVVLAATLILLPLSHLEIRASDDSWLLWVDGRPVDVAGYLSETYTDMTRHCSPVQVVPPRHPLHAQALAAIQRHSPPDSLSAQLVELTRMDHWLLAQVRFSTLQDAVVLLAEAAQGVTIAQGGVWSGSTYPHRFEPIVRRYLQTRVPAAPTELTACLASRL